MKIKLTGTFKSLAAFESDELDDFTVITGKNGSGKTHLVELLTKGFYDQRNQEFEKTEFKFKVEILNTKGGPGSLPLEFTNAKAFSRNNWNQSVENVFNEINKFSNEEKKLYDIIFKQNLKQEDLNVDLIIELLSELPDGYETILALNERVHSSEKENPGIKYFIKMFEHRHDSIQIMKMVSEFRNKPIQELERSDYLLTPISELLLSNRSIFSNVLGKIFYQYASRRDINLYQQFRRKELGEENGSISDAEFITNNPPPWDLMNEILEAHNIDFHFQGIDKRDFHPDNGISFDLLNKRIEKAIDHENLSSGEKIIIGLLSKVFLSEYLAEKKLYPGLLVFDEPDAYLHPEMSKLMIEVFQKTFIDKLGYKIIFTTHSPSTVALAPEESIYEMRNGKETSLKRISKDNALNILTGSIPTLSIDYKNHKQVFVEGESDRQYYQTLFDKLNQQNHYPFKLYFIPYGNVKGGSCDQVREVVEELRSAGNKNCFGIIDRDTKNDSKDSVIVHGERYSLENYLVDPIYLTILFHEKGNMNGIDQELGFEKAYSSYELKHEANERLQEIWDWFLGQFYHRFPNYKSKEEKKISIKYLNNKEVHIPKWYVEMQGHELEKKYHEVFKSLARYRNDGELKEELSTIAGKVFPLVPLDTKELFDRIMKQS